MRREQPRPTVGTLQWMAPELMSLQGHQDYFAADVYAFGIILWELAAREPPYVGVDEGTIRAGVKAGERPEIPADCPAEWAALIKACWAQKPADRPRFATLVGPLRALVDATPEPPRSTTPGAAQTPRPGYSERYVLGGRLQPCHGRGSWALLIRCPAPCAQLDPVGYQGVGGRSRSPTGTMRGARVIRRIVGTGLLFDGSLTDCEPVLSARSSLAPRGESHALSTCNAKPWSAGSAGQARAGRLVLIWCTA
jgi:serine/threonine protein kinase